MDVYRALTSKPMENFEQFFGKAVIEEYDEEEFREKERRDYELALDLALTLIHSCKDNHVTMVTLPVDGRLFLKLPVLTQVLEAVPTYYVNRFHACCIAAVVSYRSIHNDKLSTIVDKYKFQNTSESTMHRINLELAEIEIDNVRKGGKPLWVIVAEAFGFTEFNVPPLREDDPLTT